MRGRRGENVLRWSSRTRTRHLAQGVCASAGLLAGSACASSSSPSPLATHGPGALPTSQLGVFMIAVATSIFAVVTVLLVLAVLRRGRGVELTQPGHPAPDDRGGVAAIVAGGVVLPLVVLTVLAVLTVRTLIVLAAPPTPATLTVSVIGHQFWWEVRYSSSSSSSSSSGQPGPQVVTANEIHVPAGVPVNLDVTSTDVIHSFWVPQLRGKMDTIPGQVNQSWLQADQPGTYRGQCAEFCGQQHAHMGFLVIADPPDQFAAWLANQQQPAVEPTNPTAAAGEQAFERDGCITCHTIRSGALPAGGDIGPDLTHLASRQTLAADTLPNTLGGLSGWITNPQAIKPGNSMPVLHLDASDVQALAAYLETLQ